MRCARRLSRSDVVILSGGLGPTEDDLTKEIVTASVFGCGPGGGRPHKRADRRQYLHAAARRSIAENNWKQAHGSGREPLVLDNENGTAPGLILEKEGKTAVPAAWARQAS